MNDIIKVQPSGIIRILLNSRIKKIIKADKIGKEIIIDQKLLDGIVKYQEKESNKEKLRQLNTKNIFFCCRAKGKIKVDGFLDEESWKNAIPIWTFCDIVNGEAPRFSVTANKS